MEVGDKVICVTGVRGIIVKIYAPPIGSCSECAHRYKGHCTSGPCATEETDADFYCRNFKEKENKDNALL